VTTTSHAAPAPASPFAKHYFLLRRLHSLSGIVPIGIFLFPHLFTNSSIMWGRWISPTNPEAPVVKGVTLFQEEVNFIHSTPFLFLIEVFGIWLPLAFHAGFGFYIAKQAHLNTKAYGYQDNWRYVWQRLTGYLAFVFIFLHLASLRWGWTFGGLFPSFDPKAASSTLAAHFQQGGMGIAMAAFYLVCTLAIVFHFANGLWTAGITWGFTLSQGAMRRWGVACAGVGGLLATAAVLSVYGFATLDIAAAKAQEAKMGAEAPAAHAPASAGSVR
jgi:succinate dehydrogenase / fumarate reductase cytochrome b subunit